MNPATGITVTLLLLAINAFFVASEFAVTSSRRSQVEPLAAEGKAGATKALYAMQHVSLMLAICQLGITVMSTSLGVVAEPAIAHLLEQPILGVGLAPGTAHAIAFVLALVIVLFLHVVFGEMVPKNISIANPQKLLLVLAPPLVGVGHIVRPIVVAMDHVANWFLRMAKIEPCAEISATFTAEEVANIVQVSQEEGKLSDELGLISGTLEFSTENARDVMVPVNWLTTLPATSSPDEVERAVAHTGYSRFPVTDEDEEIIGYLHLKDVLYADEVSRNQPVTSWRIRDFRTIEPNTEIEDALRMMQASGTHMAAVVDAEELVGIVFLEDILERLVGEVRDSLQRRL